MTLRSTLTAALTTTAIAAAALTLPLQRAQHETSLRPASALSAQHVRTSFPHQGRRGHSVDDGSGPDTVHKLKYHHGPVMTTTTSYAIFWLPSGYSFEPNGSDASYGNLIVRYLQDFGGSSLLNVLTQYGGRGQGHIQNESTFGGAWVDSRRFPVAGTASDPLHKSDFEAEVTRAINLEHLPVGLHTQIFIFTPAGVQNCQDTANQHCTTNEYCAYHGSFELNGQPVTYGAMADDGENDLCMAKDDSGNYLQPNGDPVADSEISTLSHEQSEMITDPLGNAWFDKGGQEIGDKCAYTYGNLNGDGSNVNLNGDEYIVQGEWSNIDHACSWGQ